MNTNENNQAAVYEEAKKDMMHALLSAQKVQQEQRPQLICEAIFEAFGKDAIKQFWQEISLMLDNNE